VELVTRTVHAQGHYVDITSDVKLKITKVAWPLESWYLYQVKWRIFDGFDSY